MTIDPLDLAALRAYARAALERAEKATPGPWKRIGILIGAAQFCVAEMMDGIDTGAVPLEISSAKWEQQMYNSGFIAAARLDVPNLAASVLTLCAKLEQAHVEVKHLRDEIKTYENMGLI